MKIKKKLIHYGIANSNKPYSSNILMCQTGVKQCVTQVQEIIKTRTLHQLDNCSTADFCDGTANNSRQKSFNFSRVPS